MIEKKHLTIIILCAIIVSMPFLQAFSTAVPGEYVIQLERDKTITKTMDTLQDNIPQLSSITYGSWKYLLLAHRIVEPLVWIGHGDKEGINTFHGKLSWERFSHDVVLSPSMDIILSCYSQELITETSLTSNEVVTFRGEIDATLGGLVTA